MLGGSNGTTANCAKCDGAILNEWYQEDGKAFHSWCAPSTSRKDRFRQARDAVIEIARKVVNPAMEEAIKEYDAARSALRWEDL